jgi:hypothetical protein
MRMKVRKNLLLDAQAVARGERAARERRVSLSTLVEKHLLSIPRLAEDEEFWPGPPGKPLARQGDPRHDHLRRKHA